MKFTWQQWCESETCAHQHFCLPHWFPKIPDDLFLLFLLSTFSKVNIIQCTPGGQVHMGNKVMLKEVVSSIIISVLSLLGEHHFSWGPTTFGKSRMRTEASDEGKKRPEKRHFKEINIREELPVSSESQRQADCPPQNWSLKKTWAARLLRRLTRI